MKLPELIRGLGYKCLNPLQEVGVMKQGNPGSIAAAQGLNPLQEVGVMKPGMSPVTGEGKVLIPFRKSG